MASPYFNPFESIPPNLRSVESREDRPWEDEDFRQAEKNIQEWRIADSESALVEARLMARKYVENGDYEAAWQTVNLIDAIFAGDPELAEVYGRKLSTGELVAAARANFRKDVKEAFRREVTA